MYIDGELVGNLDVPYTTPNFYGLEGLSCGYDSGAAAAGDAYQAPFEFTGTIRKVVFDVGGELIQDDEAMVRLLMAQQ